MGKIQREQGELVTHYLARALKERTGLELKFDRMDDGYFFCSYGDGGSCTKEDTNLWYGRGLGLVRGVVDYGDKGLEAIRYSTNLDVIGLFIRCAEERINRLRAYSDLDKIHGFREGLEIMFHEEDRDRDRGRVINFAFDPTGSARVNYEGIKQVEGVFSQYSNGRIYPTDSVIADVLKYINNPQNTLVITENPEE